MSFAKKMILLALLVSLVATIMTLCRLARTLGDGAELLMETTFMSIMVVLFTTSR